MSTKLTKEELGLLLTSWSSDPILREKLGGHITALEQELATGRQTESAACVEIIQLKQQLSTEQKKREEAYGLGVSAGKKEALSYTPEERERYGKWVTEAEHYKQLQHRLEQAELKNAELREALEAILAAIQGEAITCRTTAVAMVLINARQLADKALTSTPDVSQWVRKEDYMELIMAVERKFEGETRHQTALRYIKEAESNIKIPDSEAPQKEEEK